MTFLRQPSSWRDNECVAALVMAGVGLALALTLVCRRYAPLPCPFHALTGYPCPTCGGTRALFALLHGHVAAAWRWQPLLAAAALGSCVWLLYAVGGAALKLPRWRVCPTRNERRFGLALGVALILANWGYLVAAGR